MVALRLYVLSFLVAISTFCATLAANLYAEEGTNAVFQKAEALYNKKRYPEALALYEKVVSIDPAFTGGYRGIVRCYNALGDLQGAVIFMESLFLEDPGSAEVSYGLGYSLYNARKYGEAIVYFEKAVELNQDLAAAWNNCAVIYHFITHDYERARRYYEKAIAIGRRTGDGWVIEIAENNLSHLPEPEELKPVTQQMSLEEFINRFVSKVDNNDERGIRQLVLGQQNNCELTMDWLLAEAMRSYAQGKKGDEEATILLARLLEKEYRRSFNSPSLKSKLDSYNGLVDQEKKMIVEGERLLKEGMAREQGGRDKEAQERYQKALSCFESIKDKSRAGFALIYLGDLHRKKKEYTSARRAYTRGLALFTETGEEERKASILSSLGITCFLLGYYPEALDFHERSLMIYRRLKDKEAEKKVERNMELIKAELQKR
jgi:tetratricopeptide (TPR) repeat protein